eukprot:Amastigsp_a508441_271.p5 type:complete len:121 gc:universal Amastigsp_a508441_271:539-177(-)
MSAHLARPLQRTHFAPAHEIDAGLTNSQCMVDQTLTPGHVHPVLGHQFLHTSELIKGPSQSPSGSVRWRSATLNSTALMVPLCASYIGCTGTSELEFHVERPKALRSNEWWMPILLMQSP